jgi:predicted molibdopterin-dependent oxidoreductase YjgC
MDAIRLGIHRSRLDVFGAKNDKWNQKPSMDIKPAWWVAKEILQHFTSFENPQYQYNSAEEVFCDLAKSNNKFNGMNYELLIQQQGMAL